MAYYKRILVWLGSLFLLTTSCQAQVLKSYADYKLIQRQELKKFGGTLLLSNSPEDVQEPGILYRGKICGKGRLLYHHVNVNKQQNLRLIIEVVNEEEFPQLVRIIKPTTEGPSYQFLKTGQTILGNYFKSTKDTFFYLEPHKKWNLYDSEGKRWRLGTLLSGMMDIETMGQVTVTYKVITENSQDEEELKPLIRDLAPRGSFDIMARTYHIGIPETPGYYYYLLGTTKEWEKGVDELTGDYVLNQGNYGIMEHIQIVAKADTRVILCPRGGVFQGMVRWQDGQVYLVERIHAFKREKECIEIGKLKKGEMRQLDYMLPNGSAAPVLLGFWVK